MSGRKIYSTELKLEIVERYLKGDIGIKKLAQEHHVSLYTELILANVRPAKITLTLDKVAKFHIDNLCNLCFSEIAHLFIGSASYASGSLMTVICKSFALINASRLHFGQYSESL